MSDTTSYTVDADVFKGMSALFRTADTIKIKALPIGWSIISVSPDHVSMTEFTVPRFKFEKYAEGSEFALSLKDVNAIAKLKGEKASVTIDDGRAYVGTEKGVRIKVPLYAEEDSNIKIPKLQLDDSFPVASEDLADYLNIASGFGPVSMRFSTDMASNKVTVVSEGTVEGREASMTLDAEITTSGYDAKSTFGFDYISDFVKAVGKGTMIIEMSTDYPIKMTADRGWVVSIIIAPRIEQE